MRRSVMMVVVAIGMSHNLTHICLIVHGRVPGSHTTEGVCLSCIVRTRLVLVTMYVRRQVACEYANVSPEVYATRHGTVVQYM